MAPTVLYLNAVTLNSGRGGGLSSKVHIGYVSMHVPLFRVWFSPGGGGTPQILGWGVLLGSQKADPVPDQEKL